MLATTLSLLIELEVLLDCCSMKDGKTDILDSRGGTFVLSGRSETELAPRDGVGRVMDNRGEDEEEEGEDEEEEEEDEEEEEEDDVEEEDDEALGNEEEDEGEKEKEEEEEEDEEGSGREEGDLKGNQGVNTQGSS